MQNINVKNNVKDANTDWNEYLQLEYILPEENKLMYFLMAFYTKNDNLSDEQYLHFDELLKNEPMESIKLRHSRLSDYDSLFNSDGYITVYRGVHNKSDNWLGTYDKSRNYQHGFSWSYEKIVAEWFAIRTQANICKLITARVHKDDILMVWDNRNEAEIIIRPKYLGGKLHDVKIERIENDAYKIMDRYKERSKIWRECI